MTHDELLAKMAEPAHTLNANDARNVYLLALRAVVELHKPKHSIRGYRCGIEDELYPCPTIQAIEKELNG